MDTIEGHRSPTKGEIKFGHAATHYKTFKTSMWMKDNKELKRFIVCPIDGLRYYRN